MGEFSDLRFHDPFYQLLYPHDDRPELVGLFTEARLTNALSVLPSTQNAKSRPINLPISHAPQQAIPGASDFCRRYPYFSRCFRDLLEPDAEETDSYTEEEEEDLWESEQVGDESIPDEINFSSNPQGFSFVPTANICVSSIHTGFSYVPPLNDLNFFVSLHSRDLIRKDVWKRVTNDITDVSSSSIYSKIYKKDSKHSKQPTKPNITKSEGNFDPPVLSHDGDDEIGSRSTPPTRGNSRYSSRSKNRGESDQNPTRSRGKPWRGGRNNFRGGRGGSQTNSRGRNYRGNRKPRGKPR